MFAIRKLNKGIVSYLQRSSTGVPGEYRSSLNSPPTLYASCFALMTSNHLGRLSSFDARHLQAWGKYLQRFQDQETGYFLGPEILHASHFGTDHNRQHISEHLTAHVLPALALLGIRPQYPLLFARKYLDREILGQWLSDRDWSKAWVEGNNLLFMGQWLIHLHEVEGHREGREALEYMLDWLDGEVDPETGLWGTNGYCNKYVAMYGGYHQLLLYYYLKRNFAYTHKLVDTVLSLQHLDGGFSEHWGGGTCQDLDAVDILVNSTKRTDYRRKDIYTALRRASIAVLRRFSLKGGFVDRVDEEFTHMGLSSTYSPPNEPNMFSTWFGLLTLVLISEVIKTPWTEDVEHRFNVSCSMGWHEKTFHKRAAFYSGDCFSVAWKAVVGRLYILLRRIKDSSPFLKIIFAEYRRWCPYKKNG